MENETSITIHADDSLVRALQAIAQQEATTVEDIARDALTIYVASHKSEVKGELSFVGIGRSGKGNLATEVEKILEESADRREGWSLP